MAVPFLWFLTAAALGTLHSVHVRRLAGAFLIACALAQIPAISVPYYEVVEARKRAHALGWTGVPAALSNGRPGHYEMNCRALLAIHEAEIGFRDLGFPVTGVYVARADLLDRLPFWFLHIGRLHARS
jgi:hypothetical protein